MLLWYSPLTEKISRKQAKGSTKLTARGFRHVFRKNPRHVIAAIASCIVAVCNVSLVILLLKWDGGGKKYADLERKIEIIKDSVNAGMKIKFEDSPYESVKAAFESLSR